MLKIQKIRNFYELKNNDAIIVNFLFGYSLFVKDFNLVTNISQKELCEVIGFCSDKKISYVIEDLQIENYKNNYYDLLLSKIKREFNTAFEVVSLLNTIVSKMSKLNEHPLQKNSINFLTNIQNLIDNDKRINFEHIIQDYKLKNSINVLNDVVEDKVITQNNQKVIKIGSKVSILKEDTEIPETFVLVDESYDEINENDRPLKVVSPLGRALLNKEEWDFIEINNSYYQIVSVEN